MNYKIGDRYQYQDRNAYGYIIEYVGGIGESKWLILEGLGAGKLGSFSPLGFYSYTYLGNFSKTDNFTELYNLLNS